MHVNVVTNIRHTEIHIAEPSVFTWNYSPRSIPDRGAAGCDCDNFLERTVRDGTAQKVQHEESSLLGCGTGQAVPSISKDNSAFIFSVKQACCTAWP